MNIGDIFTRLSNGFYPSALHRVIIPGSSVRDSTIGDCPKGTPARYSIPYFVAPDAGGLVVPQPTRVNVEGRALYEPVMFKTYSGSMCQAAQIRDE